MVVAMSGGVDSSVAACLLQEQGYDVMGLFMRVGVDPPEPTGDADSAPKRREKQGCCSASDAHDAKFVAGLLGVPFYALNFQEDFDRIIDYFADEYARGRTPNPCVVCNDRLKFGKICDYADAVGAKYIATGHYARVGSENGKNILMRARDSSKDQSYVLFGIDPKVLDRLLFPLGDLLKSEVRAIADANALPNHDKPDSVEICFVPDNDYARVVRERRPDAFVPGDVVSADGRVLGQHDGIANYTIGQRRGLGISGPKPIYVTQLNIVDNTVGVAEVDGLFSGSLLADKVSFFVNERRSPFRALVKIRYLHKATPAMIHPLKAGRVRVEFDEPQRAVTPGQAVVFYDGDVVVGGGWIEKAEPASIEANSATSS